MNWYLGFTFSGAGLAIGIMLGGLNKATPECYSLIGINTATKQAMVLNTCTGDVQLRLVPRIEAPSDRGPAPKASPESF